MHKKSIVFLLITSFLLTGCWDKIEVEQRAHISAIGIDIYNPSEDDGTTYNEKYDLVNRNSYKFTFSFPEHKKEEPKDIVISTVGDNLYNVSKINADRTNKEMFLGHLRTVIINADIAKDSKMFRQVLDGLENNELVSRKVVLAITEDSAQEIINIEPDMEHMLGEFISELFRRKDKTPRTPSGDIGTILKDLHENGNTVIPKIIPGKKDVKAAGAGVISNYQFKGWLGEIEVAQLMALKGEIEIIGGILIEYKGHNIPIEMRPKKPKLTLVENDNNIKIVIDLEAEADVKQTYFEAGEDLLKIETVKGIEDVLNKTMKKRMKTTIEKIQKEFETDIIGIDRHLRQFHYKLWEEVAKDWQEIFPTIDIEINLDAKIRRIGLVR